MGLPGEKVRRNSIEVTSTKRREDSNLLTSAFPPMPHAPGRRVRFDSTTPAEAGVVPGQVGSEVDRMTPWANLSNRDFDFGNLRPGYLDTWEGIILVSPATSSSQP